MRVSIVYTGRGPLKVYSDKEKAIREYERLRDLDDLVNDYSMIEMNIEDSD